MLKVRLQRIGRRNDPSYRVVVTDSRRGPKSSDYVEALGSYDPKRKQTTLNGERIKHWLSVGAQASDTVHNILVKEKVIDAKTINVLPKKSPIVKEIEEKAPAVEAEATDAPAGDATEETPQDAEQAPADEENPKAEETTKDESPTDEAETPVKEPENEAKVDDAPAEEAAETKKAS